MRNFIYYILKDHPRGNLRNPDMMLRVDKNTYEIVGAIGSGVLIDDFVKEINRSFDSSHHGYGVTHLTEAFKQWLLYSEYWGYDRNAGNMYNSYRVYHTILKIDETGMEEIERW